MIKKNNIKDEGFSCPANDDKTADLNANYDFGILSYFFTNNYGAALTAFAIYRVLQDMGYNPLLIDVPDMIYRNIPSVRDDYMPDRKFISKHCNLSKRYSSKSELKELNQYCDGYLVGSDSLWGWSKNKYKDTSGFYFLEFAFENKKKIAYGTSFGMDDFKGTNLDINAVRYLLNRFDAISVREHTGVDICNDVFGIKAVHVLDPVFLCEKSYYLKVMSSPKRKVPSKFIFAYILKPTDEKQNILRYVADKLGYDLIIIPDINKEISKWWGNEEWKMPVEEYADVEDLLYYISHANYVITDSYHGFCFSVIFERNFICLEPRVGYSRFASLNTILGLGDRIGINYEDILNREDLFTVNIDYSIVHMNLEKEKERCLKWLKNALKIQPKTTEFSTYDMLGAQMDIINSEVQNIFKESLAKFENQHIIRLNKLYSLIAVKLLLSERLIGKKVAIKGAGEHTARLFQLLDKNTDLRCIVAKNITFELCCSCDVITDDKLIDYDVDIVVISSFKHRKEMKNDILKLANKYEIIDIYESLEKVGVVLDKEYYYAVPSVKSELKDLLDY